MEITNCYMGLTFDGKSPKSVRKIKLSMILGDDVSFDLMISEVLTFYFYFYYESVIIILASL